MFEQSIVEWLGMNTLYSASLGYLGFVVGTFFGFILGFLFFVSIHLISDSIDRYFLSRKLVFFSADFCKDFARLNGCSLNELRGERFRKDFDLKEELKMNDDKLKAFNAERFENWKDSG
jgi:hypothetical protein